MAEEKKEEQKLDADKSQRPSGGGFKKKEKAEEKAKPQLQREAPKKQIHIVRVAETDLDGAKTVRMGIREIRGVSFMMANAISSVCPLADKKIIDLSEDDIKQIEDFVFNPEKHGIPVWMLNRRFDPDTGLNRHVAVSNLQLSQTTDINRLKKMKCYKGVRHGLGLPVRGQRTRSSFRGKGTTVGVSKVKEKPAKAGSAPAKK